MTRMIMIFVIACGTIALSNEAIARGAQPPPPPFSGGNVGSWLGSGPIFGFDDGGGPGGGWGGVDGWGGWGSGPGGSGGYGGGNGGSSGGGHVFDDSPGNRGGLYGTCWRSTLPGGVWECACVIAVQWPEEPISGVTYSGLCQPYNFRITSTCRNTGDACSGTWP